MFLYIDANAIVGNPLLKGPQWDAVGDAVVTDVMDLYVSELTIDEAVARYRTAARAREKTLDTELRKWPRDAHPLLLEAIAVSRAFRADYERLLRDRLDGLGATTRPYGDAAHQILARRALDRLPPFDSNGNGYRDTLHWLTFVELLEELDPIDPHAYLLSSDKGAFGHTAQKRLQHEVDELGVEWNVEFLKQITDFTVPGQFLDEEGSLEQSHVIQLQQVVESAILGGGSPDFTHYLARRVGFDDARITAVSSLNVAIDTVRVDRRTLDLWVTFTAEAVCVTDLETVEVLDDDYSVVRDSTAWVLAMEGTAVSRGTEFSEVATLRLQSIDGDENLTGAIPLSH